MTHAERLRLPLSDCAAHLRRPTSSDVKARATARLRAASSSSSCRCAARGRCDGEAAGLAMRSLRVRATRQHGALPRGSATELAARGFAPNITSSTQVHTFASTYSLIIPQRLCRPLEVPPPAGERVLAKCRRPCRKARRDQVRGPMRPLSPTPRDTRTFVACRSHVQVCLRLPHAPTLPSLATLHTCHAQAPPAFLCLGCGFCPRTCGEQGSG